MRVGAGPPPPRPRASSVGTAVDRAVAIVMRPASRPSRARSIRAISVGRDFALAVIAPAEHQDRDCGGEEAEDRHPPDVPDQRKAGDHRKESE